jgi:ankyrin repeat protein
MEPAPAPSTALLDAVKAGDTARIESLVAAHPQLLRFRTPEDVSPVRLAMYCGHTQIARLLVALGAVPDIFDACAAGLADRVREFVDADEVAVNAAATDGFHPLGLASFFGHHEIVGFLLERGADVNAPSNNAMRVQPLHSAAAREDVTIVRMLLTAGADPNARQQMDFTPLHAAAQNGNSEMVEVLLAAGADPTLTSADGRTAADCAAERGHRGLADSLAR